MKCPHCGFENADGIRFCQECGAPVAQEAESAKKAQQTPPVQPVQPVQNQQPAQNQYGQNPYGRSRQPVQNTYGQNSYAQNPYAQNQQPVQNPDEQIPYDPYDEIFQSQEPEAAGQRTGNEGKPNPVLAVIEKIKSLGAKTLGIIGGGAVALILLIVLIAALVGGGSGKYVSSKPVSFWTVNVDGDYYLLKDGKAIETVFDGIDQYSTSINGKKILFTSDETLYSVEGTKAKKLQTDMDGFIMSPDGSAVLYSDGETIYIYHVDSGKKEKLADISEDELDSAVFSPNGKLVVYTTYSDADMYVWKNGKSEKIGKGYPVSVSDNGKYIYYLSEDSDLYVTDASGKDKNRITKEVYNVLYTNINGEELLFSAEGKIWLTVRGKEKVKISSGSDCTVLTPQYSGGGTYSTFGARISPVRSFIGAVIYADSNVGFVNGKGELERLAKDISTISLSSDASRVFYIRKGDLYTVKVKSGAEPVKLKEDVDRFLVMKDGKTVYATEDDELYRVGLNGKDKMIADDVYSVRTNGKKLFILGDYSSGRGEGTLYGSSDGKNKKKIADDVTDYAVSANMVTYTADDEYYVSTDGSKFEKVG